MRIICVDDEEFALSALTDAVKEVSPDAEIKSTMFPNIAVAENALNPFDVAFLDIKMRGVTGLELSEKLKKKNPKINIIFVTGYDEFAMDAIRQHCSGYVLKPVTEEQVRREMKNLLFLPKNVMPTPKGRVFAQTFGNFELYIEGKPVKFEISKSKEVFAYLVDRRGVSVQASEIAQTVFGNCSNLKSAQVQVRKVRADLIKSLTAVNAEKIIKFSRGEFALNTSEIDCDYWRFLNGDEDTLKSFPREYMTQYEWSKTTLENLLQKTEG